MKKHFETTITDTTFTYTLKTKEIAAEAALDGFYILRTSLTPTDPLDRGCGARLQEPRTSRASVRITQGPGLADPPDPPSP
jgi:hypothetical protein